jgi:hypothetical protein
VKTQTSWWFSPDEFAHVWESETGLDTIPFPISILETPSTSEEYEAQRLRFEAKFPQRQDADLIGPMRVLANPDLQIISWGRFHHSDSRIRTLAAASADLAVVLFQKSGPTQDFGGDVRLVATRRQQLGRHLAATLPQTPAGALAQMRGYTPRVRGEEPPSSWGRNHSGQSPVEERIRMLLRTPRSAEGYLRIERHLHNDRPYPPAYMSWFDVRTGVPAVGRYLVEVTHTDTLVTPASAEIMAAEIFHRADLG